MTDPRYGSDYRTHTEKFRAAYPDVSRRVLAYIRFRAYQLGSEAIEDARDEVMARLWATWSKKSIEVDPIPLAMVIARNHVINEMIKTNARTIVSVDESELGAAIASVADVATECSELVDAFNAMRELPEDLREVAAWIYICDLSRAEVANILGVRERDVRTKIDEVRRRLRKAVGVSSVRRNPNVPARSTRSKCGEEQRYRGTEGWAR